MAPGQLFSFNKTVGDINAKTGYASAYVIQNGRTVLATVVVYAKPQQLSLEQL